MEYTVNKLAKLAGVSTRTLRYYDEIGLLKPARVSSNSYRIYGQKEIDRLQQIMLYRELDLPLEDIKNILDEKSFDGEKALQNHLTALLVKRERIDLLINNVEKTIKALKGETTMSNKEKFDGFGQKLVNENERRYGKEIREKYGDEAVERSNAKVSGMTKEQYAEVEKLSKELNDMLRAATELGDPASELAQEVCEKHKQWLCYYWGEYSKEAHLGLAQMYVDDPRFTEYYDKIAKGATKFLRDALQIYCS
ncbi:MAG: MerR family transcriptional regulator [Caldicoprobacterales bacterium]